MPINARWSDGVHKELTLVARLFNVARASGKQPAVEAFRASLALPLGAYGSARLLTAVETLAHAVLGAGAAAAMTAAGFRPSQIDSDWFSPTDSQWRFDSVLSPEQMHEIMREAGVQIANLCLDGKAVELLTQCNHNTMHVDIYPPGEDDNRPARIWIFVPSNSGWVPHSKVSNSTVFAQLAALATRYPPGPHFGPGTSLRSQLLTDIDAVVTQAGQACLTYRAATVPFNWGRGYDAGPAAGSLTPFYDKDRREPDRMQNPVDSVTHPAGPRTGAIVIGWSVPASLPGGVPPETPPTISPPTSAFTWQFPISWIPEPGQPIPPGIAGALAGVQANILRPHGREVAHYLLFTINDARSAAGWLSRLSVTTAAQELELAKLRRTEAADVPTDPVVTCGITRSGFTKLDRSPPVERIDADYERGFWADRDFAREAADHTDADVLVIIAGEERRAGEKAAELRASAADEGLALVGTEMGRLRHNSAVAERWSGPGFRPEPVTSVEPFGHVDGISNPRFFSFDITPASPPDGATIWPVGRSPLVALVPEGGGGMGSYLVFQKLQQHADEFHSRAERDAGRAPTIGDGRIDPEPALMGRNRDGSVPWADHATQNTTGQTNDFTWDTYRGPLRADDRWMPHIRAVNGRQPDAPVIVRRSMPYSDESGTGHGEGLLFGAYMASISDQFGSIERRALLHNDPFTPSATNPIVTLRGGGYFYIPSPGFLSGLGAPQSASAS